MGRCQYLVPCLLSRSARPASVSCASVLSSFLKLDGIYVGLRMKIRMDGSYVVTSRVRRIGVISSLWHHETFCRTCLPSGPRALTPRRTFSSFTQGERLVLDDRNCFK